MLIRVLPPSLFLLPVWCISLVLWRARVPRSLLRKHATCWTTASWSLRVLPDTTLPTHPSPMAYHWVSLSFLHFFKEMRGCDVSHVKNIIVHFLKLENCVVHPPQPNCGSSVVFVSLSADSSESSFYEDLSSGVERWDADIFVFHVCSFFMFWCCELDQSSYIWSVNVVPSIDLKETKKQCLMFFVCVWCFSCIYNTSFGDLNN